MELKELYAIKGELITKQEIVNQQLQQVNGQIAKAMQEEQAKAAAPLNKGKK